MITHAASRKQYTVLLDRPEGRFFCDYLCGAIVLPAALSFSALSEKIGEKRSGELRLAHAAGTGSGKSCFRLL